MDDFLNFIIFGYPDSWYWREMNGSWICLFPKMWAYRQIPNAEAQLTQFKLKLTTMCVIEREPVTMEKCLSCTCRMGECKCKREKFRECLKC